MPNFTKQAIKDSFLKLLNQQPLSKISVRSIVEDCGINRNSFYYHYQDIPALLGEIIQDGVDMLIEQYPTISSLDECVQVAFHFARENRKAVQHIFNSANRDIYESYYMKQCEYIVRTYLDTVFGKDTVSEADPRHRYPLSQVRAVRAVAGLDRVGNAGGCPGQHPARAGAVPRNVRAGHLPQPAGGGRNQMSRGRAAG